MKNRIPFTPARWAVSLIFATNGFLYASWISRLPRMQEIYDLSHGDLGLLLLCAGIGALISMPLTGWIIVRLGSRRLTMLAAIAFCLAHPLLPWMGTFVGVGAIAFLIGMFSGSLDVSMNAQAILVEERLQRPVMSSFHAFFSFGMMLGAGLSSVFVQAGVDIPWHLLTAVALGLLVMTWSIRQLLPDPRQTAEETQTATGGRRRGIHPALLSLGMIAFCGMLGEGAMADWSTNYLEKVADASRALAPLALAAFSGAMTTGRVLGDFARLRFGDHRLLYGGGLIALFGLGMALIFPYPIVGIVGFFLVGAGLSNIVPIIYSTAGKTPGLPPGLGISMVSTIGYAGFLIGPPIIGFIADWLGLRIGLAFVALLFVVLVALALLRARRPAAATTVGHQLTEPGKLERSLAG